MNTDSKSGAEVLALVVGAGALLFGTSALTWWVAHQFAWWTYALLYMGSIFGWHLAKAIRKEIASSRRDARAARLLAKRILATRRVPRP